MQKMNMAKRMQNEGWILFVILVLALVLRLPHLDDMAYGTDDKDSIQVADRVLQGENIIEINKKSGHPPLFYFLVAGVRYFTQNVAVVRLVMVLFGLLGISVFYYFVRSVLGKKVAQIVAVLMALSPMHILYSQHVRSYIVLSLVYILATLLLYNFIMRKKKVLPFLIVAYIVSFYLHLFSLFYIGSHILTILFFAYVFDRKAEARAYFKWMVVVVVAVAAWIPIFRYQFTRAIVQGNIALELLKPVEWPYPFYKFAVMADVSTVLAQFPYMMLLFGLMIILVIVGIVGLLRNHLQKAMFFVLSFFPAFIALGLLGLKFPVYNFKYFSYMLPVYLLFVGYGISMQRRVMKYLLILVIIIGWLIIINYYYSVVHMKLWNVEFAV